MPKKNQLDNERELLASFDRGEWVSTRPSRRTIERYQAAAAATMKKDRRVNIRMSKRDLESIQKRALHEGLPYQTLIASILHKYVTGRLSEKA